MSAALERVRGVGAALERVRGVGAALRRDRGIRVGTAAHSSEKQQRLSDALVAMLSTAE